MGAFGATATNAMNIHETDSPRHKKEEEVDWTKVGKVYNKNTQLNEVFDRELSRLNKALDAKLAI